MTDTLQAIEYRRLVASIASHLSQEEVERILFIRNDKFDSTSLASTPDDSEGPSALHALAALERQGEFSLQNIDGLAEIAKDVNRHDLVRLIDGYKKTRCSAARKPKIRTPKLLRKYSGHRNSGAGKSTYGRERSQLEETYEMMVTRFTFLEQQMSLIPRLLEGEGDLQDEGTVILTSLKYAADELAAKLAESVQEFYQEFDGSISGSFEDLSRRGTIGSKQHEPSSPEGEVIYARPSVHHAGVIYDTPTLPSVQSQNSKQLLVRPPIAMVSRRSLSVDTREGTGNAKLDEDQDFTGDSGFSASSKFYDDSDPYCVVDLWRRPPPNRLLPAEKKAAVPSDEDHGYMSVCTASMNAEPLYETVQTPTKT